MTTPNPAPDERADERRSENPYPPAAWAPPEAAAPNGQAAPGSVVGRAYVPAPPFPHEPLVRGQELLIALAVACVLAVAGFPLGWLWAAIAPKTPVQMIADGAVLSQPEQEQMIADEGWYLFLTVLAGVLVAALAWAFLRRYRGVPMVVALAVGSVVGGSIAAWFGHHIGYAHFRNLATHAPVGTSFTAPVNLRVKSVGWWHHVLPYARGDVLAMAIAALVIYLLLVAFSAYPSLRGPDPAPLVNVGPGDGYPGYPMSPPAGRLGEVEPGAARPSPFSSDL